MKAVHLYGRFCEEKSDFLLSHFKINNQPQEKSFVTVHLTKHQPTYHNQFIHSYFLNALVSLSPIFKVLDF